MYKKNVALATLLALCLFLSGCHLWHTNLLPSQSDALRGFYASAFSSEYGDEQRNRMIRWKEPISISVKGRFNQEDLTHLSAFFDLLHEQVPLAPPLSLSSKEEEAHVVILFDTKENIAAATDRYVAGNRGFFTYKYQNFVIVRGNIYVNSALVLQQERDGVVEEELINLLGLCNDIDFLPESLLYTGTPKPQSATQLDYDMLNILYHPALAPGMNQQEAQKALVKAKVF